MAESSTDRQRWLDRRLRGLGPGDFMQEGDLLMCSPQSLVPPQSFAQSWFTFPERRHSEMYVDLQLADVVAIVVFADPGSEEEMGTVCEFAEDVGNWVDAPPVLWVPHSQEPELRSRGSTAQAQRRLSFDAAMSAGVDAVIPGEPEVWSLTLAVQTCIVKSAAAAAAANAIVNHRREQAQQMDYLKRCIDSTLWDYLRVRCARCIPPMNVAIPGGDVTEIHGYSLGSPLGAGRCGRVFMLERPDDEEVEASRGDSRPPPGVQQVLKVVNKGKATGLVDLKCMKRMIDVMQLLSSDQWRHENIVQLYDIYHSPTHLFFRMECGGPTSLFHRLNLREKERPAQRQLPFDQAASLLSQAIGVVAFLQLGPHVCHRDLKPENFTISETDDALLLKLCDFDLACIQDGPNATCRCPCGTFPFFAPEVLLEQEYNGEHADVWSLGVVLLEMACRVRFLERSLNLPTSGEMPQTRELGHQIVKFFQPPTVVSDMVAGAIREELLPLKQVLLDGTHRILTLQPQDRLRAADLQLLGQDVLRAAQTERGEPS